MSPFDRIDFKSLIAKETNGRMLVRLMALSHIKEGANNSQTARNLHISRRIVNDWVKSSYAQGLEGLKEETRSGSPSRLSEAQLSEYIRNHSIKESGGRLYHYDCRYSSRKCWRNVRCSNRVRVKCPCCPPP